MKINDFDGIFVTYYTTQTSQFLLPGLFELNYTDHTKKPAKHIAQLKADISHLLLHLSLILSLSSSVPAEGHNMADSFGEALKVPMPHAA